MKLKNTLLLLIFAGGLFAFISLYERHQLSSGEAQDQAGRVVTFNRDRIDTISIKNAETKIELHKETSGSWRLLEPVKDLADSMAVSQLFTSAEALRFDAAIGSDKKGADKDQLKEFGLSSSETKLKFSGQDKPVEFLFGKDAAIDGKVYVKLENSNVAYVIGRDLKEQISKRVDEFRDRRLTDISTALVTKLTLKAASGEIEAERKDQHWSLTKPLKSRADDSKINDLVSQAATARIEAFMTDTANLGSYGLEEPRATISLTSERSTTPTLIQLGGNPKEEKDKGKIYAKASTRDAVVLLPPTAETLVSTTPNDLRDRNLVRLELDIVDRVNIEDAKSKIILARSGESWVRKTGDKDTEINVAAARRLIEQISSAQVAAFVSDVSTDLAKYGLDQPSRKVTLSSYASENTAETKAGEKPIVTILFGKVENGTVFAKLEEEPFIVSVPQAVLETLLVDPLQWQPLEIFKNKSDDISALEVTRAGGAPLSFEKDKTWKLAKGDGAVNQVNVQSLTNTLATLRAVRWEGATVPDQGLEHPAVTLTFKTANGGSGRLLLGTTSSDDLVWSSVDGKSGTFLLSSPDASVFALPLIDKPVSPAPASTDLPASASQIPPIAPPPEPVQPPATPQP